MTKILRISWGGYDKGFYGIETLTRNLNETAARECISAGGVTRIMKAYNYHAPIYQSVIASFCDAVWSKGLKYLDIPTAISLSLCPYMPLQWIGIYALASLSENLGGDRDIDDEFENQIPFLFEIYNNSK